MPRSVLILVILVCAAFGLLLVQPVALALGPATNQAPEYTPRPNIDSDGLRVTETSPALDPNGTTVARSGGGETRPGSDSNGMAAGLSTKGETRPNIDPNG